MSPDDSAAPARAEAGTLVEARRNRLLRQVDWRFLLPSARPAVVCCLTGGEVAEACALFAERLVAPREAAPGSCDLVVCARGDRLAIQRGTALLRPGGCLYAESHGQLSGELRHAGLAEVRSLIRWPAAERAEAFIPAYAPEVREYVERLVLRSTPGRLARARAAVGRFVTRSSTPADQCVIARRASDGAEPLYAEPFWLAEARNAWPPSRQAAASRKLTTALLTRGPRSISKVIALIFAAEERSPGVIVKLPRVPESDSGLAREARALRQVGGRLPGIPRLLFHLERDGVPAVGEDAIDATPLGARLWRRTFARGVDDGADWLARLAGLASERAGAGAIVEAALADFARNFGRVVDPAVLAEARATLRQLGELPVVAEHRDFSPWNVGRMLEGGALAVFDWESSEPRGVPGLDLVYFLAHMAFHLDGALGREASHAVTSYRRLLDRSTFTGGVAARAAERYAAAVGIDATLWRPLRTLTWLVHTRSDHARLVADAGGEPTDAALRTSTFLQLLEAEMRAEAPTW